MPGLLPARLPFLGAVSRFADPISELPRMIWSRAELARQRRALNRLEARLLADIGLCPEAAGREAMRPGWDAPEHWTAQSTQPRRKILEIPPFRPNMKQELRAPDRAPGQGNTEEG